MWYWILAVAGAASLAIAQELTLAKSYTGWDCCKGVCSNGGGVQSLLETRGVIKTCDRDNNVMGLEDGLWADSGCNGGTAFMCQDFAPVPVTENLSYGFAIQVGGQTVGDNPNCCKCYEIEWVTGSAADQDKKMIVQIVTPGGTGGDIVENDLIILTPGGGVGPLDTGCTSQYGNNYEWGDQMGGFTSREGCGGLPPNLQGGCYWRFNWARGDINGWDILYKQVQCPERLTSISGCVTNP